MKSGWQIKTLGEVCEIMNGGTPKTAVPEYWDGKHLWITPAEMGKRLSPYVGETERMITDLGLRNSSAQMLPPNSVILSSRAPIGHLVINTKPMATNQGCRGLIPSSQLQHKFLYYYLSSIIDLLNSLGNGTTFKELSGRKLKEVTVPVPPLLEQQRIVGILDKAFAGLATAKANAEKNYQNARALFESHLQSVFTQHGPVWMEKPLETVASILNGYAFKSTDFSVKEGAKCIKITNVGVREFVSNSDGYLPKSFAAEYEKVSVKEGSIVLALTRTIIAGGLKVAVVPEEYDGALLNQRVASIIPDDRELNGAFLFAYLSTQTVVDYVKERVNTLMQPNLSITDLRSMPISAPPRREQNKITEQLDSLREETQRLETIYQRKLAALEALKKSLLHQAFSGEL
jgi:type I restriction enzyme, S subunit